MSLALGSILAGVGSAASGIMNGIGSFLGMQSNDRTNSVNAEQNALTNLYNLLITDKTNAANLELGRMNAQSVRETNALNKELVDSTNAMNERLQREQWSRDDTAYQRMVADMNNAGLNPLSQFNSPTSSGLSAQMQAPQAEAPKVDAVMQAAKFNAAVARPFEFNRLGEGFSDFANAMLQERNLNLQEKGLNLKAITSGVNPIYLDNVSDSDELVNFFKGIFEANLKDAQKNANSPYVRGEGMLSRAAKDSLSLFNSVNSVVKSASGNDLRDIPKVLKEVKPTDSRNVVPPKEYSNRVQEYYYNNAHKNHNSSGRAFGNFIRSKIFKR